MKKMIRQTEAKKKRFCNGSRKVEPNAFIAIL